MWWLTILWLSVSLTPIYHQKSRLLNEYLSDYEAIYKKDLTNGTGAQTELFYERIGGRKSHDKVPLTSL
jgi:hypothetical protein